MELDGQRRDIMETKIKLENLAGCDNLGTVLKESSDDKWISKKYEWPTKFTYSRTLLEGGNGKQYSRWDYKYSDDAKFVVAYFPESSKNLVVMVSPPNSATTSEEYQGPFNNPPQFVYDEWKRRGIIVEPSNGVPYFIIKTPREKIEDQLKKLMDENKGSSKTRVGEVIAKGLIEESKTRMTPEERCKYVFPPIKESKNDWRQMWYSRYDKD